MRGQAYSKTMTLSRKNSASQYPFLLNLHQPGYQPFTEYKGSLMQKLSPDNKQKPSALWSSYETENATRRGQNMIRSYEHAGASTMVDMQWIRNVCTPSTTLLSSQN